MHFIRTKGESERRRLSIILLQKLLAFGVVPIHERILPIYIFFISTSGELLHIFDLVILGPTWSYTCAYADRSYIFPFLIRLLSS
jgi:hypothetical protein